MNPIVYEAIRIEEKRRLAPRLPFTLEMYNYEFRNLARLYFLYKKRRINTDIDIYFKIKFFRQVEKFPFINPMPYMSMERGVDKAFKDVGILSFSYFFI
jgi:hypothetical protein